VTKAVKTSRFLWIMASYFTALFVWYSVLVHQTIFLIETGFDSKFAAMALALVGLFGVFGQIVIGALSDRIGREWAWTISLLGFVACYACLLVLMIKPLPLLLYLMVIVQGFLGFGLASIYGAAVGPWLTGYIFDNTGSYKMAFWLCIAVSLVSIFCIWMAAPRKVRLVAGQAVR
jgi:predicted MFS family arabinose efflux permease